MKSNRINHETNANPGITARDNRIEACASPMTGGARITSADARWASGKAPALPRVAVFL